MLTALAIARATWGFLGKIPWQAWAALAAVIAMLLIYNTGRNHGEAETQAAWDAATRAAIEQAREADDSAHEAIDNTRNNIEAQNNDARDAAESNPVDPLGAALRSLRRTDTAHVDIASCGSSRVRAGAACA